MKHIFHLSIVFILLLATTFTAQAQLSQTSYFMESYTHRHLMNAALTPSRGYVSLPAIGFISTDLHSSLSAGQFLFPDPQSDQLLTFMHPDVEASRFLNGLQENNPFGMGLYMSMLSAGFYVNRHFITLGASVRTDIGTSLPKGLFALLKQGMYQDPCEYNIARLRMDAQGFTEYYAGFSTDIFSNIRVGAKVKYLAGVSAVQANIDRMNVRLSSEEWVVDGHATVDLYGSLLSVDLPDEDGSGIAATVDPNHLTDGSGLAVDLGATYSPLPHLTLSVALNDLGGIWWKKVNRYTASGTARFEGVRDVDGLQSEEGQTSIDNLLQWASDYGEESPLSNVYKPLHSRLNIGAEYEFLQNKISAATLFTSHFTDFGSRSEWLFSANFRPLSLVEVSGSYTLVSGYAQGFGVSVSLLNCLYFSWDRFLCHYSPQYLPLDPLTSRFEMGISVPIGQKRDKGRSLSSLGFFEW